MTWQGAPDFPAPDAPDPRFVAYGGPPPAFDPRDQWIAQLTAERDVARAELRKVKRSLRRANIGAGIIFAFMLVAWIGNAVRLLG
ncbi:hypothetical protein [Cellulomonas olei]|uniref:hypothetical protein n=1 Tax=Cellulomonas sp. P4 TaxID=3142533 RepID=UPI0031BA417B